jgi:transposase
MACDSLCGAQAVWSSLGLRRILAYREPVDLRKSFQGLVGLVKERLAEEPLSGTVCVFVNKRKTLLKSVYWDRTGFCLFAKRLERGRFRLPQDGERQELSAPVFQLLLDGIELGRRQRG